MCKGITDSGAQCAMITANKDGYCHHHINQCSIVGSIIDTTTAKDSIVAKGSIIDTTTTCGSIAEQQQNVQCTDLVEKSITDTDEKGTQEEKSVYVATINDIALFFSFMVIPQALHPAPLEIELNPGFVVPSQLKLVIFDLDDTLIHGPFGFWNDTPELYSKLSYYARHILHYLKLHNVKLGLATHNSVSSRFTQHHGIHGYFEYHYFTSFQMKACTNPNQLKKNWMFESIKWNSNVRYSEILLFDDLQQNIDDAAVYGIRGIKVDPQEGVAPDDLLKGFAMFD